MELSGQLKSTSALLSRREGEFQKLLDTQGEKSLHYSSQETNTYLYNWI